MIKFTVVSDSMVPVIKINDELVIEPKSTDLETFDIILFKRKGQLFVHFIWRNQLDFNNTVITRSLKNIYHDEEPVHYAEILGKIKNFKLNIWQRTQILALCFAKRAW